ncbi:tRNA-uridine aminocarboxypropyltransferase [Peredibacter sp. HCB2-198]|uniref:tRNA-uridine aminocarboxypropyltransferase n=1 Tax=Peredibacter sp. HCB2-198 TaxID=3383025 RepID=UPI0038B48539
MNLCLKCRRRNLTCVCALLKPFKTTSRFIILMHPMEFKKEKVGTGRFSHLILENSKVVVDVGFDENAEFQAVLNDPEYESFVLYPGVEPIDLGTDTLAQKVTKKAQFIVIDGTWPCAKKMMKLTTSLHHVPRVSFKSDRVSEFKVKHQPMPGCLSTVESIHQVLLDLNRMGMENTNQAHDNLMDVFRHTVNQQIDLAKDPNRQGYRKKPFSLPENRKISKKWEGRLLFFKESGE